MNFKQLTKPSTTITVDTDLIPNVTISEKALSQMFIYTKEVSDEVGWLGTAYKQAKNLYHIEETFLFDQEVHATTTEITPEGLGKFAEELLAQPGGAELWNDIKMWGHSHVNMPVNPSGQDDKQMEEFSNVGHDFFIRLICNKKGELRIDVYDYENGLTFKNVQWFELKNAEENDEGAEIAKQIEALNQQLEALNQQAETFRTQKIETLEAPIKEEIKKKVKKFSYKKNNVVGFGQQQTVWGYGYDYGSYYEDSYETVNLRDFFTEEEIKTMVQTVYSRAKFEDILEDLGVASMLTFQQVTSLYSKIAQERFMPGGKK